MVKKSKFLILYLAIFSIFFIGLVHAEDFNYLISNSEDWKDVYSVVHYANLKGMGSDFLVGPKHGPTLLTGISKDNDIRIISSKKSQFVFGYGSYIKGQGFKNSDEIFVNSANLELISDLKDVDNFIIVGNTYGYNAVAVAPYAVLNRAWVFFADRNNIDEIDAILASRNKKEVIIYGLVDKEVKDTLSKYNPEIINNDDRFKDNIEIFKKYIKIKPSKQIALTNGEFIEKEIMSGLEPVLFTGKDNVPDQIRDFIKETDVEVGVLIGADLVGAATNIRRSTGISVIVKFARGARVPTGSISAVEGIDIFYVPSPTMKLDIYSAKFNKANSQLEIVYNSESNVPVFFKGTINLEDDSGENTRIGDLDPLFIAPNSYKTVVYPGINFTRNKLTAEIFTLYGETQNSLEKILEKKLEVGIVNVIDKCEIEIKSVEYSKSKKGIYVKISNIGSMDCWSQVEIKDIYIDGVKKTIFSEGSQKIVAGKTKYLVIKTELSDDDINRNSFVDVTAYYGEREDNLLKAIRGRFELNISTISYATIGLSVLGIIILIAIFILFIIFFRRRRKEDEELRF